MKPYSHVFTMFILTLALLAAPSFVQATGCVTSDCHETMGTAEFVHGPVGAQICTVCHAPTDGDKHKFALTAEKEDLCFGCHEDKRDMMLEDNLHTPVAKGDCVGCHDPHQSANQFTLKGDGSELCYTCHDRAEFGKEFVHGPVAVGDCNVCHNPHASENAFQLNDPAETICFNCHAEQADIPGRRHAHKPVTDGCPTCHSPHSADAAFMLKADPPELCYGCHSNISGHLNMEYQHDPVATGQCHKCHDVHGSENPRLFPRPQMDLCLSCHDDLSEYLAETSHKHGPVKDGDCNACHDPHGSTNHKILRKYFPEEFYMPYDADNFAICFDCHNRDLAMSELTTTLTDFREGDRNLHYLHVNKDVKGRSCKACHQPHASNQEKHIRESVPFGSGSWELPITYTKLDDGGSCVVGCHAPKEYHR